MLSDHTIDDLTAALETGAIVFDVREPDEYRAGHVPGAVCAPLSMTPLHVPNYSPGVPIYVICQSGGRSRQAAEVFDAAGLDARNVLGGTAAWAGAGRPLAVENGAR